MISNLHNFVLFQEKLRAIFQTPLMLISWGSETYADVGGNKYINNQFWMLKFLEYFLILRKNFQ